MHDPEPVRDGAAPDVSVIIPVHGDRGGLALTLDCLAAQRTTRSFEVLVVDNGDNDGLAETLAPRGALVPRLVREERKGSYAARNTGVAAARGDVLAFTDGDCLPRPTWLEEGVAALEREGHGVFVGGRITMRPARPGHLGLAEVWQVGHDLRQDFYVAQQGWAATANLFVRASDLSRVGAFDAQLQSGGDREWGLRATSTGVRGVFAPDAVVDHPTRPTMTELMTKRRRVSRGSVDLAASLGQPVHADGTLRALRPPLRAAWRDAERLDLSTVDRARLVAITAGLHVYQRGYEARLSASGRSGQRAPRAELRLPRESAAHDPLSAGGDELQDDVPEVSVVIPALNARQTLGVQLDALSRQRTRRSFEVLVADNGSSDGTADVVRSRVSQLPGLRLVDASQRRGSNVARNVGTQAARAELVLLCDADDEVDEDWLETLATALDAGAHGVGGTLELRKLNPKYAADPHQPAAIPGVVEQLGFLPRPTGANAGFRRSSWADLGGFDERYVRGGTETEFFWRLQLTGGTLQNVPEAVVHYRLRTDARASLRQMYTWGRQHAMLYREFRGHGLRYHPHETVASYGSLARTAATVTWRPRQRMPLGQQSCYRLGRLVGSYRYRVIFL